MFNTNSDILGWLILVFGRDPEKLVRIRRPVMVIDRENKPPLFVDIIDTTQALH